MVRTALIATALIILLAGGSMAWWLLGQSASTIPADATATNEMQVEPEDIAAGETPTAQETPTEAAGASSSSTAQTTQSQRAAEAETSAQSQSDTAAAEAAAEATTAVAAATGTAAGTTSTTQEGVLDPENTIIMELKDGTVKIKLRPDLAPKHVERIKTLSRDGFYDGVVFHRVIDGFMAQTGDPTGTGSGGSSLPDLPAEFSAEPHVRGITSMARTQDPNSANSQFFIVFDDATFLDNQYTVWGQVVEGMEHVDSIKKGDRARNGAVSEPDKIISMKVMADVPQ